MSDATKDAQMPAPGEKKETESAACDEEKEQRIRERLSKLGKPEEIEVICSEGTAQVIAKTLAELDPRVRVKIEIPYDAYLASRTLDSTWEPPDARSSDNMTWDELFAPMQADFEASGMTEEELCELIDSEIADYRAERRAELAANRAAEDTKDAAA